MSALAFQLPDGLEAHEPPEARGGRRDDVRLLVSDAARASIEHARFADLPRFLAPGDLLVVNTSATLPAALPATRDDGTQLELRLSTPAPGRADDVWIVELRLGDAPFGGAAIGERIALARGRLGGAPRPVRRRPAHRRAARPARAAARVPGRARAAHPLRLRPGELAAGRLPDRVRARARQRRDAERRTTVHGRADHAARRPGRARRADHASHRRLLTGTARATVPGALQRSRAHRPARQRRPSLGRPRHRDRDDGRAGARDRRPAGRSGECRRRLDEPRRHSRTWALDRGRAAHRPARVGVVAPGDAPRGRGRRPRRAQLPRGARSGLPLARVRRQPPDPGSAAAS